MVSRASVGKSLPHVKHRSLPNAYPDPQLAQYGIATLR
jgi:hypothetical protein